MRCRPYRPRTVLGQTVVAVAYLALLVAFVVAVIQASIH